MTAGKKLAAAVPDVDNIITELSNNDNWIKGPSVSAPLGLPLTGSNNLDLRTKDHLEGQF